LRVAQVEEAQQLKRRRLLVVAAVLEVIGHLLERLVVVHRQNLL
jgi:hypothetical protein